MTGELILIVEDNERNLKLVRDLLQFNGYETIVARNAESGVMLAAERRPDLVLMDIQLPDSDGITALARLRADDRTASLGVVALTAFAMPEDRERLLRAGFDGYLEKPISVREFPAEVQGFLDAQRRGGGS
jgi:two-component system cell cycle response regulator DivK